MNLGAVDRHPSSLSWGIQQSEPCALSHPPSPPLQEEIDRLNEEIEEAEEAGDEAAADKLRATRRDELVKKMR